jgi:DNA-binding NtrC family response regulator
MTNGTTILVIDDEKRHRDLYAETLRTAEFNVLTAENADVASSILARTEVAMIVSDVRMPGKDGIAFLEEIMKSRPGTPYLLITAYADVREAIQALRLGAVDYLEKPVDLDELVTAVRDALGIRNTGLDQAIRPELTAGIIAESTAMRTILSEANRVAASDASVLITGESGVGKEVLAAFLHRAGPRAKKPLVVLNCAAMPANLIGSELFGHEKGAFTGAVAGRRGRFREADGGTLFLDEIGDMPLELQPALLRALDSGMIAPLGNDREIRVDVRLIAATNKVLSREVEAKRFREDLFYRLNVFTFEIPPLRERPEDILALANRFLAHGSGTARRLSPAAATILERHSWPGNVRELANAMERASILATTPVILPEHLPQSILRATENSSVPKQNFLPSGIKSIDELEQNAIRDALEKTGGNRTRAAELLGISRRTLLYKLKKNKNEATETP